MKKLFLFLPALLLSLVTNAATINVSPGTTTIFNAYKTAAAGDVLILASGTYEETERLTLNKSITIQAAEEATPVVRLVKDNQITGGASIKFVGIKFDGSAMTGSYEYAIRSYDATAGNKICLDRCEVTGFAGASTNYFINAASASRTLDSIIINNCYFHNTKGDAIYVGAGSAETETCKGVIVKNSTFANITPYHSVIDVNNYGNTVTPNIEVTIDHCTFYNNVTTADGYAGVRSYKSTKVNITNSIFAHSEAYARCGTYCYGGSVSNCLAYNLTNGTNGHHAGPTLTGNIVAAPLFANAAESNFTLNEASPAVDAGTDGKTLGDPRWWPKITLPETDFAAPYVCDPADAKTNGRIALTDGNLVWNNNEDATLNGVANWKISVTRACYVSVTVTEETSNGHCYSVTLLDADGNPVGEPVAEAANTWKAGDLALGTLIIPAPGEYSFKLTNSTNWSTAAVSALTLSYIGGEVQSMPGTTNIADAWFSPNGTRADGVISFADATTGWAKWNINVTADANYEIALTIKNMYGHNMTVALYEEDGETLVGQVTEGTTVYDENPDGHTYNLGSLYLNADNYVIKVTNATSGSDAKIASVTLTYVGGAVQNMPGTTDINDAWFSANGTRADGKIDFPDGTIQDGWVKWNVAFASAANYNVTLNVNSDNCKNYTIALVDANDVNVVTPLTLNDCSTKGAPVALSMGTMEVPAGNYILKVTNATQYSDAELISVQFVYAGGGTIDIPGSIALSEAILSTRAYMDGDDLHFTDADHLGTISGEYAKWNINVAADGIFTFTANCNASNHSHMKISVMDEDENVLFTHQTQWSFNTATSVVTPEWFLEAGNYILKAENPADWSDGYLTSLSAAQVANILIVDENATDMAYINEKNGQSMKPLLKRSFRSGMFNTVCFPFNGVTAGELESIFGAGYQLLEMSSATLADNVLTLNFSTVDLSGDTYGRPYLIKPTQDVVNPLFNSHTIYKSVSHLVAAGDNANFVGSFIKGTVPAGEDNLFLGANDLLYFSEAATTIKGMRAYFQIHDVPSGAPIRQARIVEQGNVVTALEFVNGEWQEIKSANGTIKTIENGQLILIRDGKRYNVMGVRF